MYSGNMGVEGEMLLLNRRGGRWEVRHMGKGRGGMKGSVEKKERAGSRIKGKKHKRSWVNSKVEENGEMKRRISISRILTERNKRMME
jgi:hypothetical protein